MEAVGLYTTYKSMIITKNYCPQSKDKKYIIQFLNSAICTLLFAFKLDAFARQASRQFPGVTMVTPHSMHILFECFDWCAFQRPLCRDSATSAIRNDQN